MPDTTTATPSSEATSRYRVLHAGISVSSTDSKDRKRADLYRRGDVVELTAEQAERLEAIGAVEKADDDETGPNEVDRTSLEVTGDPRAANEAVPAETQRRGPGRPRKDEQPTASSTSGEGESHEGQPAARRSGTSASRKG